MPVTRFEGNDRTQLNQLNWIPFRNDSGETIPAFGVMRVTGMAVGTGQYKELGVFLTVNKPNTFGAQYSHAINGAQDIQDGQYGECTLESINVAKYDTGDGTPAYGELWGPRDGSWLMKKNTGGFLCLGLANEDREIALFRPSPFLMMIGKANGAGVKDGTVAVSVWHGTSASLSDTGEDIDPVFLRFGPVESGAWLLCSHHGWGWEGIVTTCPTPP